MYFATVGNRNLSCLEWVKDSWPNALYGVDGIQQCTTKCNDNSAPQKCQLSISLSIKTPALMLKTITIGQIICTTTDENVRFELSQPILLRQIFFNNAFERSYVLYQVGYLHFFCELIMPNSKESSPLAADLISTFFVTTRDH